mmetsp:Transcript_7905/g.11402  ORF Transcript_7905/g.11402 Transcript_7905/m.11402 type:complete len:377 (-) Transcript_7905:577-1707(-)
MASVTNTNADTTPSPTCSLKDSRFSCNICLDAVSEPVVTQCGHLYCWSCLYRWLEPGILPEERKGLLPQSAQFGNSIVDTSRRRCPVCKAECSVQTLIPLYVRNEQQNQQQTPSATHKNKRRNKRSIMKNPSNDNSNSEERLQQQFHNHQQQQFSDDMSMSTVEDDHSTNSIISDHSIEYQDGTTTTTATTGIQRRLRFHNNNNNNATGPNGRMHSNNENETEFVPSRPPAPSPLRRSQVDNSDGGSSNNSYTANNNNNNYTYTQTPRHINPISPATHRPSLSHGLALLLWQTLFGQETGHNRGTLRRLLSSRDSSSSSSSSSLDETQSQEQQQHHQHQGGFLVPPTNPEDDQTAEFLSRLLALLGSFVIICLILF